MLSFCWRWKKFGGFVFCKVELKLKRIKATRKDEDEEKEEEGYKRIPMELLSRPKELWWVFSYNKGVQVFFFAKRNLLSFFWCRKKLNTKKMKGCTKKPIKLLSTLKETWWVFFLQSQIHMEKSHNTKKRWWRQKCLIMIVRKNPLSFSAERSSMGLFYVPNVCMLKQTRQTSFNVERSLGLREVWQEENEGL